MRKEFVTDIVKVYYVRIIVTNKKHYEKLYNFINFLLFKVIKFVYHRKYLLLYKFLKHIT